ncbi:MAG: hypothetical protein JJV93_00240 [Alphaproteobacteria bacterium]|nr:hypothetical protein [Alphaproteobacteria bacterium]MBL0717685.1 hypothetical protein [Alphaproteobacteria bacterium]
MSKIYFLNVGNGDSSIIQHYSGRLTMIDINNGKSLKDSIQLSETVTASTRGNFGEKKHPINPIDFLKKYYKDEAIFRFFLTHPDMDHLKGIKALKECIGIDNFWGYKTKKTDEKISDTDKKDWDCYKELLKKAHSLQDDVKKSFIIEDGLKILSPTKDLIQKADIIGDWNDCSGVILYKTGNFKILFCGDSDDKTWEHLIKKHKNDISNIDLFIAPHHGRDSGRGFSFLEIVNPGITMIGNAPSACINYNKYRDSSRVDMFTNNQGGNFMFEIDNDKITISCSHKPFAEKYREGKNLGEPVERNGFFILCEYPSQS